MKMAMWKKYARKGQITSVPALVENSLNQDAKAIPLCFKLVFYFT